MATRFFNSSIRKGVLVALSLMASLVYVWAEDPGTDPETVVATIGEGEEMKPFPTLEAAITEAGTATESAPVTISIISDITLSGDVSIPDSVTLSNATTVDPAVLIDLNGHNLSVAEHGAFANSGALKITDSSTGTAGTGTVAAITNSGFLALEKVLVTTLTAGVTASTVSSTANAGVTTLTVPTGATTTISGAGYVNLAGQGSIKLGGDISSDLSIASGNSLSIDLCGHKLTGNITNAGTLTVNDTHDSDAEAGSVSNLTNNSGSVTVNCAVTNLTNNGTGTVNNDGGNIGTLTSNGGTVTANGEVTKLIVFEVTTISGEGISAISGRSTIKLGAAITQELTLTSTEGQTLTLDLNGKSVNNVINAGNMFVTDSSAEANGTIASLTSNANTTVSIEKGSVTTLTATESSINVNINGENGVNVTTLDVAADTNVKFTGITTAEALNTAIGNVSRSTIELGEDISSDITIADGKNITLDLKGNNIEGIISNAGTLVLNDAGKQSGDPGTTNYGTITTLSNKGTLTVNQGKVTTLNTETGAAEIAGGEITIANATSGSLKVTGGTISTLTTSADNIVTVESGTITTFSGGNIINFPKVNTAVQLTQALKAQKPVVTLTAGIDATSAEGFKVAANSVVSINVGGQTITNTQGDTFTVLADGSLTFTGTGNVNCGDGSKVAVNNAGTFTLNGPAVESATLNGKQTVAGGTLTLATLASDKDLDVTGGEVKTLNAAGTNTVKTSNSGLVETLTANGAVSVSGNGFKQFQGPDASASTITLTTDIASNLTVASGKVDLALNDKTISNKESQNTLTVADGATLTVTGNGTITNINDGFVALDNSGNTTLSGGTVSSAMSTAGTLSIGNGSTVTTLTAGAGTATLNGGTVANLNGTGTVKVGVATECDLIVTGGEVTLDLNGLALNITTGDEQKTVTVNSGATLNVQTTEGGSVGKIVNVGTTNISRGTVTTLETSGTVSFAGGAVTELTATAGTVKVNAAGIATLNAKSGSTIEINAEASMPTTLNAEVGSTVKVGEEETLNFSDIKTKEELEKALLINKGGSLKLTADDIKGDFIVPEGSNITIDLNGHNINASSGSALTLNGTATLKGCGTVDKVSTTATAGVLNLEGSTVTTLDNAGTTNVKGGTVTTVTSSTGTLKVEGGHIDTATATGTTTVSAGTVATLTTTDGNTTITGTGVVTDLKATDASIVTISDGNVTTATAGRAMTVSGGEIGKLTTTTSTVGDDGGLSITAGNITTSLTVVANSKAEVSGGTIVSIDVDNANLTVAEAATVTSYSGEGGANVKLPSYTITDDNSGSYPVNFKATAASYTRTKGIDSNNTWGTACLPFSYKYNNASVVAIYKVKEVADKQLNLEEYANDAEIAAGTPFVFKIVNGTSATTQEFTSNEAIVNTAAHNEQSETGIMLVGVNEAKVITETSELAKIYFISDNHFHQAKAKLTVPKYRAYLKVTESSARPSVLSIATEPGTTALDTLCSEDSDIIGYYDMNGVMHDAPQKGTNIVKMRNGKSVKMIIK